MLHLLDRLERRVNTIYWSDGLLDLLAGLGVAAVGLAWLTDLVALGAAAPAMLVPLWPALRARIVEPRRGHVELAEARKLDQRRLLIGLGAAGIASLMVALLAYFLPYFFPIEAAILVRAMPGVLVGLAAVAVGTALELPRFGAYALALVGVGVGSGLLGYNPGWAFVAGGGLALLVGLSLLIRFMRRYGPVQPAPAEAP